MIRRLILFLIITIASLSITPAQEADTLSQPKVGLVLSGGAAKGLAHIGVLKVLEEIGITPDYITGTSMGAVVGGLYALGYTADEISELNRKAAWEELLSDRIPLNEVVFEEKHEYRRYIIGIPIRNYKIKLPSGMIEGQQLEKFFADLMFPLPYLESYDSLPIPFRCMAVDLIYGNSVEFNSGYLAESIRASMSIPSIFAPESIDSMLLVDGGVIRNFPVDEVKKMGADLIIGVYVGFNDKVTKEDLFSLSDVLSRATVFFGIFDSQEQMQLVDVLIQPDLKGLGATDFSRAKKIEVYGEVAALEIQNELYKLADSLGLTYKAVKKIQQPNQIFIDQIVVENERSFVSDNFIIKRSRIKEKSYVTKENLSNAIDRIFGTQYFKKVTYNLQEISKGKYKLIFKVKESTRAFINVAAHYDNQYGPGLITNLTLRNYLFPSSRATVSLNVAENPGLRVDINKYVGKNERVMDNIFLNWNQNENSLYENELEVGAYDFSNLELGIGGKFSMGINQQIGILGFYEFNRIYPNDLLKNHYNIQSFDNYGYRGFAYKLFYKLNRTNDNFFPTRGQKLELCYKYNFKPTVSYEVSDTDEYKLINIGYFDDDLNDFYSAYINMDFYTNVYNTVVFNLGASIGISSDESAVLSNYSVGGFEDRNRRLNYVPFVGMKNSEVIVPNYGLIKAGIDIQVLPNIYISSRANIALFAENKEQLFENIMSSSFKSYYKGYSLGIRANTIIGPINVMYSDNDFNNKIRWYISIGYPF